jgi:hypothetical protein
MVALRIEVADADVAAYRQSTLVTTLLAVDQKYLVSQKQCTCRITTAIEHDY